MALTSQLFAFIMHNLTGCEVLICIALMICEVENLFLCMLSIFYDLLWKCLFKSLHSPQLAYLPFYFFVCFAFELWYLLIYFEFELYI